MNADSILQIAILKAENEKYRERLQSLEEIQGTWELRLAKELKHKGDQYSALQEKYNQEVDARKKLEERLKGASNKPFRRPNSQNRGRGKNQGHLHANGARPNVPPPFPKGDTGNLSLHIERRTSGLPLPIRPSTPIRPALNRDPGSSSSTLVNSSHSTFSRASPRMNESFSSISSTGTIRSASPPSPTTANPRLSVSEEIPTSPTLANETIKPKDVKKPSHGTKPSWANLVARSASKM